MHLVIRHEILRMCVYRIPSRAPHLGGERHAFTVSSTIRPLIVLRKGKLLDQRSEFSIEGLKEKLRKHVFLCQK